MIVDFSRAFRTILDIGSDHVRVQPGVTCEKLNAELAKGVAYAQERADLAAFEQAVRKVPEVMECYLMSGEYDYLLRVVVAGTADFERVHSRHLTGLPHVARVHSSFALRTVQKSRELPLR